MVETSFDSSTDFTVKGNNTVKFVCSYGGKILPRHPDGKLRYVGGETRVVSIDRSLSFTDLLLKLGELYGSSVCLRCQLPQEDLDALVSITCDEDVANLMEEYDRAAAASSSSIKIKAFLSPKSVKKISPPASVYSSISAAAAAAGGGSRCSSSPSLGSPRSSFFPRMSAVNPCVRHISTPMGYPMVSGFERSAGTKSRYYPGGARGNPTTTTTTTTTTNCYLVHNGNHWQ